MNSGGGVDTWTIVSGSIPPGMQMPSVYGAGATIIGGTPTRQGTFTFTVDNVPFNNPSAPPSQGTYSITVGPPLPLKIVLPASGSTLPPGTVGVAYAQNFFLSGGVAPYTWSVAKGQLRTRPCAHVPRCPRRQQQPAGWHAHRGRYLQVHHEGHRQHRPVGITAVQAHHKPRLRVRVAARDFADISHAQSDGGGANLYASWEMLNSAGLCWAR